MYPYIQFILPSYSVCAVLGGFITLVFLYLRIEKYGLKFGDFIKMFVLCVLFGFLGSRAVYVFSRLPWLITHFSAVHLISTVIGGGFVFYGGLLGVLLGVFLYTKKCGCDRPRVYNMVAPAIPLFHSIGRIGCFMAGCCYGFELPGTISVFGLFEITHFPTQLIEAVFEMCLFAVIFVCQKLRSNHNYLRVYMVAYAIFRFIIEFFRGDTVRGLFFGISTSQLISIGILAYYIIKGVRALIKKSSTYSSVGSAGADSGSI